MSNPINYAFPAIDATATNIFNAGSGRSSSVTTQQTTDLTNTINEAERQNFLTSLNTADTNLNAATTYSLYASRNMTISNIATDMTAQNNEVKNGAKDTYTRQAEINEWQAQNKLDTLFFLQLTFLFFSLIVILLFLRRYGILPNSVMWMIIVVFTLILIGTLWNRASYTMNSRDNRYWNRRYIGLDDSGLSGTAKCPQ